MLFLSVDINPLTEGEDAMSQEKEVAVKKGCKLVCKKCERERSEGTRSCGVCGCKKTKELCLAFLGEEIIPSLDIATENPPPRLNAASSFKFS